MTKKDCLKIDSSVFSRPQNDGIFTVVMLDKEGIQPQLLIIDIQLNKRVADLINYKE